MSSNELHITRANYVEYFLMYVDGELTPAQNDAVEAFAALHPDLQEELDILLTTKLDAEPVFFNKEALMADSMKHTVIDESLLLYIDNELEGNEKADIEKKIQEDSTLQYQHHLLQQTKLVPETIPYPNKEELYRKDERKVRPMIWFRAAAAVFVLVAAGYMWQINQSNVASTSDNGVAVSSPALTTDKNTPAVIIDGSTAAVQEAYTSTTKQSTEQNVVAVEENSKNTPAALGKQAAAKGVAAQPAAARTDVLAQTNTTAIERAVVSSIETPVTRQHIINTTPVTNPPAIALDIQETAPANPGINDVAVTESADNKKGTMKGLLRKASRFIERRTGVAALNDDDDELLIGAVAIKLK